MYAYASALVMVASALLIVGFSGAADKGFTPKDYGIIGAGVAVLILLLVHVLYTKRNAIIPTVRVSLPLNAH